MATATIDSRNRSVNDCSSGAFTGDGAATKITLGFNPVHMIVVNETGVIRWEKLKGMAAANSIKIVTAGTTTVDATSAILFNGDGTVTLSAALSAASAAISWVARR